MQICRDVPAIRAARGALGGTVALVPTMGALHEGHMALVAAARARADSVIATVFVNPTQFGEAADLAAYPRDEDGDLAKFRAAGVDAVFLPDVATIYPPGDETIVETTRLANMLHGKVRPGHFRGVTTVVARLFNIVAPDIAVFGEKDYQQLVVIRRMVRDLHFPVEIVGVPTVRAPDGLALSSRNARLDADARAAAPVLSRALDLAEVMICEGTEAATLDAALREVFAAEPRASLRGLDIVDAESLDPLAGPLKGATAVLLSAEIGGVLLIDQRVVSP